MDKTLSIKIQILSFFSIIMVVICHSYNLTNSEIETNKEFIYYFEYLFSSEFGNIVVIPVFFFLSGYLFFFNHNLKPITFKHKIKKRIKTLLLPYIIWCLFWFLFIYGIQFIPEISLFFDKPIIEFPWNQQIWIAFVDPIYYPFWFLRELIFFVLATPLVYIGIKYLNYYFMIILVALIFLKQPSLFSINGVSLFQFLGFLFFSMGAYASIKKINLISNFKTHWYVILLLGWGIFISLHLYTKTLYKDDIWIAVFFQRMSAITGFFAIILTYDLLNRKYNFTNKKIYTYSFFIYSTHGIIITYAIKLQLQFINENHIYLLICYILTPILVIGFCVFSAQILNKITPKTYSILTGGR